MSFEIVCSYVSTKFFTCLVRTWEGYDEITFHPLSFLCSFEEKHDDRLTSSTRRLIWHNPFHLLPRCYPVSFYSEQRHGRYIFEEKTESRGDLGGSRKMNETVIKV